jgi:hypothetical protein
MGICLIEDEKTGVNHKQVLVLELLTLQASGYLRYGRVPHWNEVNFNANLLQSKDVIVLHDPITSTGYCCVLLHTARQNTGHIPEKLLHPSTH